MPKFNIDFLKNKDGYELYEIFKSKQFKGRTRYAFYLLSENSRIEEFYIKILLEKLNYRQLTKSVCKVKLLHLLLYKQYYYAVSYLITRLKPKDLNEEDRFGQTALSLSSGCEIKIYEIYYSRNDNKFSSDPSNYVYCNGSEWINFKLIDHGAYNYGGECTTLDFFPTKYMHKILKNASDLSLSQLNEKFYVFQKFELLNLGIDQRLKYDNWMIGRTNFLLHGLKCDWWLCMF